MVELMVECVPNTVDAAVEKHKPEVVIDGDKINVTAEAAHEKRTKTRCA